MATSEQLEREAEATRARIAATLDELRGRMTPGHMIDELVDYARDSGGGDFVRNFGRQVVDNPIPVTLVGAGLAWLMMAGRGAGARGKSASRDDIAAGMSEAGREHDGGDGASTTAGGLNDHAMRRARGWAQQTRATAGRLSEGAGQAGASLQATAGAAGEAVSDTASAAYAAAAERSHQGADAIRRSARTLSDSVAANGERFLTLLQEQPLVLAGLGLAIGSLLGAALPMTDAEDQLMGEASDAAKREAKAQVAAQLEKGQAAAAEAWRAAKPEIEEHFAREADGQRAGADQASAAAEPGHGATLVPSDHGGPSDTAGEGTGERARRDVAQ